MPFLKESQPNLLTPSPIVLSAVTPSFGSNNATVSIPDNSMLANPHRTAMLIDEIRFHAAGSNANTGEAILFQTRASFTLGRNPITNGFVPLQMFGKSININDIVNVAAGASNCGMVTSWRLPKPLYVPAGEVLIPRFQYTQFSGSTDVSPFTIEVAYCGRVLPYGSPTPTEIDIPWVSVWIGNTIAGTATKFTDQSRETDLVNPFTVPLQVQRFIGRLPSNLGGRVSEYNVKDAGGIGFNYSAAAGAEGTLIRMANSFGGIMIKDLTPFYEVFHLQDKAWTVNTVTPANTFYTIYLFANYFNLNQGSTIVYTPMVSLIGHRKVKLQ